MKTKEPFKVREVYQPNILSFDFMGFGGLTQTLKLYAKQGLLIREKRYRIEIREVK